MDSCEIRAIPLGLLYSKAGMRFKGCSTHNRNTILHLRQTSPHHTLKPPLFSCLVSPTASKLPFHNIRIPWTALTPCLTQVTLCPLSAMLATVLLSNVYSKVTWFGMSWSCSRGSAIAS